MSLLVCVDLLLSVLISTREGIFVNGVHAAFLHEFDEIWF